LFLFCFV